MTASHSSRARGLTPLFSVVSSGHSRADSDEVVAELVDDDGRPDLPRRAQVRAENLPPGPDVVPTVAGAGQTPRRTANGNPGATHGKPNGKPNGSINDAANDATNGAAAKANAAVDGEADGAPKATSGPVTGPDATHDPGSTAEEAVTERETVDSTAPTATPVADPNATASTAVVPAGGSVSFPAVPTTTEGLPLSLDVYAIAVRAVVVLIGSQRPAEQIAKTAIGLSIESEQTAAVDTVVPRAIDLVLYRAKALVSAGIAADVVEDFETRLELWRRLSVRSGLEPAAIVLSLAPFPPAMIASMLRVSLEDVEAVLARWNAGQDPDPDEVWDTLRPAEIAAATGPASDEATAADPNRAADRPTAVDPAGVQRPSPAADAPAPTATSGRVHEAERSHEAERAHDAEAAAYARASVDSTRAGFAGHGDADPQGDPQAPLLGANTEALDTFLDLPEGRASRLRQLLRRRRAS